MIEPKTSTRRPNADYRWTKDKTMAFLRALVATGSVKLAARHVGMSRQSAYRLRARLGPDFAAVWDKGLELRRNTGLPNGGFFAQDSVNPSTSVSPCPASRVAR